MIFIKKPKPIPELNSIKKEKSFCIKPLRFEDKTYWLHHVEITWTYLKDSKIKYNTGGGTYVDAWQITNIREIKVTNN